MFIKDLGYKTNYLLGGFGIIWKTITKSVAFLGTLVTTFELLNTFYQDTFHFDFFVKHYLVILLIIVALSFFLSLNYRFSKTFSINGCDSKITIKIGNIINESNSFVISTNTSFITIREAGFISKKSVQGQFEDKYYLNNLSTLDSLLSNSLKGVASQNEIEIKGKKYNVYSPGTIAQIHKDEQSIYFMALNDINESGQNSSRRIDDYYKAISELWNYIEVYGHTDDLAIPLIGTGRAGIEGLTKEKVAFDLIDTFITQSINKTICTRLIVYIHPSDLETVNIKRLLEYASFKTKYIRENKLSNAGLRFETIEIDDEDPRYDYYEEQKIEALESKK